MRVFCFSVAASLGLGVIHNQAVPGIRSQFLSRRQVAFRQRREVEMDGRIIGDDVQQKSDLPWLKLVGSTR
jgi:hypothetical protein